MGEDVVDFKQRCNATLRGLPDMLDLLGLAENRCVVVTFRVFDS